MAYIHKSMNIQSIIFNKNQFTESNAKSWLKKHGFTKTDVDKKKNTYRFRQQNPQKFIPASFRILRINEGKIGISLVLGKMKE